MTTPLISLCIPTFNRARYLDSLLRSLTAELAAFPHAFEIVISDNACTDDTPEVVARHQGALPIRYIRHPQGIGCYPNVVFAMTQARGRYMMYLADDDCVLGDSLADALNTMEADPGIVITYAPWMLYDLVANQAEGQFYQVPRDLRIERGQHAELLGHVLRHHIFPEIYIARTEVMKRLMPRVNDIAFYAFSQAADYLAHGAVLVRQQPFYVAITRYFADETRSQVGNGEVEIAWDRYRGGLEYMLARAGTGIGAEERAGFHLRIQGLIAARMAVAIRLRHAQGKDPLDIHTLAMRLKGMGYEHLLPVPMDVLAAQATLHFLLKDPALNRGMQRMVCVGTFDTHVADYLAQHAERPVEFLRELPSVPLKDTLLYVSDRLAGFDPDAAEQEACNVHMVRERDLCERFGLATA
jgi:poly(ribitol-phosphate) beta-N-acetylglucosaminyltransferase